MEAVLDIVAGTGVILFLLAVACIERIWGRLLTVATVAAIAYAVHPVAVRQSLPAFIGGLDGVDLQTLAAVLTLDGILGCAGATLLLGARGASAPKHFAGSAFRPIPPAPGPCASELTAFRSTAQSPGPAGNRHRSRSSVAGCVNGTAQSPGPAGSLHGPSGTRYGLPLHRLRRLAAHHVGIPPVPALFYLEMKAFDASQWSFSTTALALCLAVVVAGLAGSEAIRRLLPDRDLRAELRLLVHVAQVMLAAGLTAFALQGAVDRTAAALEAGPHAVVAGTAVLGIGIGYWSHRRRQRRVAE